MLLVHSSASGNVKLSTPRSHAAHAYATLVNPPTEQAMKSHAVVFTGPNRVSFQAIDCPSPGPEDLLIELHHSWISNGTEGSFLRGERTSGDVAWRPGDPAPFPMVAGYQKVGRVLQVGAGVQGFAVGDWVFASMSKVLGMFDNEFAGHVSPSVCHQQNVQRLPDGSNPLAFAVKSACSC